MSNNDNFILIHLKNKSTIIVNKSDYSSFLYDSVETSKTVIHMSSCNFPLLEMYGNVVKKDFAKLKLLSGETEFHFPKNNRCNSIELINDRVCLRIPSFNVYYKFVDFTYESIEKLSLDKKLLINVVGCLYQFVNSDLFCIIRDNIVLCIFCLKTMVDSPRKYLKFTEDDFGYNIVILSNSYRDESCVIVDKREYSVFKYK